MKKLEYEIEKEFASEIGRIKEIINQLKLGNIYENRKAKCYGYLLTNVENLEKEIFDLLDKIQNGKSNSMVLNEIADKINDSI